MVETLPAIVPVYNLHRDPYRTLVAYPKPTADTLESRIRQLNDLGITELEFQGPLKIGELSVLGKGVVGLVFSAVANSERVAIKIRRVDSRRSSMNHETEMMKAANNAGVGPKYLGSSEDILKMQFIEGQTLPLWISGLKGRGRRARVRSTLRALFEQCTKLDALGLDHGELSRAHKNILVSGDDLPWILDFESASLMRRVKNFTSLVQYVFLSQGFGKKALRVLGPIQRDDLVSCLRFYKTGNTNDAFEAVSKMFRL